MTADSSMTRFLEESSASTDRGERFQRESEQVLRIDVDGGVWLKPGAAVAYRGDITFHRQLTIRARSFTNAALRELMPFVRAVGKGRLYCAHHGWNLHVIRLMGETVSVSWHELLAFDGSLQFEQHYIGDGLMPLGDLRVVKLAGFGTFVLAVHGRPVTLPVSPRNPVITDPHATLAWTSDLKPRLKTDLTWRAALGHGGQEPFQMLFEGSGHVVVQPHEHPATLRLKPMELVKKLAG